MPKKNIGVGNRAWNLLRLALLRVRKGGMFKRRLMMELRLFPKFIKCLGHNNPRDQLHYGERQLSFDKTPIFHVKMHRPASMRYFIPCITPQDDFDYDFDGDESRVYGYDYWRKDGGVDEDEEYGYEISEERVPWEDEEIDLKAEEFIAKFHRQMKMQRQNSYLEYNERPTKSTS